MSKIDPEKIWSLSYRLLMSVISHVSPEVATLGLDEILDHDAVVLIEWGERFPDLFPAGRIEIRLSPVTESTRQITINQ